jgi:predicted RNA methylase
MGSARAVPTQTKETRDGLKQQADEMMGDGRFASAAHHYGRAMALAPDDPELLQLKRLAEARFLLDDDVLPTSLDEHLKLRLGVAAVALCLPCLVVLALAHGTSDTGVRFTLPSDQTLVIRSEHEGAAISSDLAASLAAVRAEGRDLRGWTGGTVWQAGQILARVLVAVAAEDVIGRRVLELGTGCGMPGLVAGGLGAEEVWLTDHATPMAQANLDENFGPDERWRFSVHQLSWGNVDHIAQAGPPFELLLGADISYNGADLSTLASTMAALSQPGTVVWWATADGNCDDPDSVGGPFWEELRAHGFQLTDLTESVVVQSATSEVNGWLSLLTRGPIERLAEYVLRDRRYFLGTQKISVTRMVMVTKTND